MVILMTSTVKPNQNVFKLILNKYDERLKQYKSSIRFYLKAGIKKLVVCDNSLVERDKFAEEIALAKKFNAEIELISFQGNHDKASKYGKGYGEGEIVKYAVANSILIKNDPYFVKVTGRLKVINIVLILDRLSSKKIYINLDRYEVNRADTRIYAMSVEDYKRYFAEAYLWVNDPKELYLENVYFDIILRQNIVTLNFPLFPRILGIQGSTGEQYTYTEYKAKIKDILCRFQYYRIKS